MKLKPHFGNMGIKVLRMDKKTSGHKLNLVNVATSDLKNTHDIKPNIIYSIITVNSDIFVPFF